MEGSRADGRRRAGAAPWIAAAVAGAAAGIVLAAAMPRERAPAPIPPPRAATAAPAPTGPVSPSGIAPDGPAPVDGGAAAAAAASPLVASALFPPWPGQEGASIEVRVTTTAGMPANGLHTESRPVPGAKVTLLWTAAMADLPPRREEVGVTGPDGSIVVAIRPWVAPRILASAEGFAPGAADLPAVHARDIPGPGERRTVGIPLDPLAPWRARVVDARTGGPIAGATVSLPHATATTGPGGAFEIPAEGVGHDGGPFGAMEIAARGYARRAGDPGALLVGELDGGESAASDPVIALVPGTALRGVVLGPDGEPFRGAEVRLDSYDGHYDPPMSALPVRDDGGPVRDSLQGHPAVVTGADGGFEFAGLDPARGTTRIAALGPGLGASETLFFRGEELASRTAPVTLRLRAAGRVVVRFRHGDRPAFVPAPELAGPTTAEEESELLLRETAPGVFERGDIEPGRWVLLGRTAGDAREIREVIEVAPGSVTERIVDLAARADFLEGVVLDDAGRPATGDIGVVVVPAALADGPDESDHDHFGWADDETGRFRIDGLPPGELVAWADRAGATGPRVRVATGQTAVTLTAPRAATVRIRLRLPADSSEESVGASYLFLPASRGANFSVGREAREWSWEADPAATALRVTASGWATLEIPLRLAAGAETGLGSFEFAPGARVVGRVVDPDGNPVEYPEITVNGCSADNFRGGNFQIDDVAAGRFTIRVSHRDYLPLAAEGIASGSTEAPETVVRLRRGALLVARPADDAFLPMQPDWTARAVPLPADGPPGEPLDLPVRGRQRRALRVEPGRWRIEILAEGAVLASRDDDVVEGGDLVVTFPHPSR